MFAFEKNHFFETFLKQKIVCSHDVVFNETEAVKLNEEENSNDSAYKYMKMMKKLVIMRKLTMVQTLRNQIRFLSTLYQNADLEEYENVQITTEDM